MIYLVNVNECPFDLRHIFSDNEYVAFHESLCKIKYDNEVIIFYSAC